MLYVKTLEESNKLLKERFPAFVSSEEVLLMHATGRILFKDVLSGEYVPTFNRSTVDGYAVISSDTFGCSDSIPVLLKICGSVVMGESPECDVIKGSCCYVPTGGAIPYSADAMVMIEYADELPDGTVAINKPSAPGMGIIFKGDDVEPGVTVLKAGKRLGPADVGALAAMGKAAVSVYKKPKVAVFSTGDELVLPDETPSAAQIRDVNQSMLISALYKTGANPSGFGILKDNKDEIKTAVDNSSKDFDMVLISGATSVGINDVAEEILEELGEMLVNGIALKPGKPTIAADVRGKPVIWLPGHPAAAYFVYKLLVEPLLFGMMGCVENRREIKLLLSKTIPSNHGREECVPISINEGKAIPISTKSGLISTLSRADGFTIIPRDSEGIRQGELVSVILF